MQRYQLFINGELRDPHSGQWIPSYDPYTGEAWAEIPAGDAEDARAAIAAADEAFRSGPWGRANGYQRAALLRKLAGLIEERADEIARLESRDNGKPIRETSVQVKSVARAFYYFAGLADKITGHVIPLERSSIFDFAVHEPLGVIVAITAWNSPFQFLATKLAPALAAGNTVVVKPSELASVTTLLFGQLVHEAGFPPGVVNVVTGYGDTVGTALTTDPRVAKVTVTGGVATGLKVAAATARHLIPGIYELGGKSANIVFEDADLSKAVPGAVAGIFAASGQTCTAGSRLLLHRSVYDEFLARMQEIATGIRMGNPLDPETQVGPLMSEEQVQRVQGFVDRAVANGAKVLCGGSRPTDPALRRRPFYLPTILTDVRPDMEICQEEVFGPVLAVLPFSSEEEAIAIANDTKYGLAAGLWTENIARAHRVASRLRAGTVWVNTYRVSNYAAPFGGSKLSGYGREKGILSILEFTHLKNVMIDIGEGIGDPFAIRA